MDFLPTATFSRWFRDKIQSIYDHKQVKSGHAILPLWIEAHYIDASSRSDSDLKSDVSFEMCQGSEPDVRFESVTGESLQASAEDEGEIQLEDEEVIANFQESFEQWKNQFEGTKVIDAMEEEGSKQVPVLPDDIKAVTINTESKSIGINTRPFVSINSDDEK